MSHEDSQGSARPGDETAAPSRRASYEPPRVTFVEALEVIAVGCQPSPPAKANPGTCPTGPISS